MTVGDSHRRGLPVGSKKQYMKQNVDNSVGRQAFESRISDLQPGEQRFLSYAVDVGVEIKPYDTVTPSPSGNRALLAATCS